MSLAVFAQRAVFIDGQPFSLAGRPYLRAIYASTTQDLVIRASRQVEKTTYLVNRLLRDAVQQPSLKQLVVCPREEQAVMLSAGRLAAAIRSSPSLSRLLWRRRQRLPASDIEFDNGSLVYVRSAFHTADRARGLSVDQLFIDEFQDLAPNELPVLQETLSHSKVRRTIITGTPKVIDNHLEAVFARSTAKEWRVPCNACGRSTLLDERVIGLESLVCPQCGSAIHANHGSWHPRNPDAAMDGYHICHLMAPWMILADVRRKQDEYDSVRFKNEVLGLPSELGDHLITREQLERCCEPRPMAASLADVPPQIRERLMAGIDWGGSTVAATVLVIGCMAPNKVFSIYHFGRWRPGTDPDQVCDLLAATCRRFRVRCVAADGGGQGHVYDRLLLKKIGLEVPFWELLYSGSTSEPRRDGALVKWTIDRTSSIGTLFARIKNGQVKFPRAEDCGGYLADFVSVFGVYDDHMRSIRYEHTPGQPDDAMHAVNYADVLGLRLLGAGH